MDPPPPSGAPTPPGDVGPAAPSLSAAPPRPMRVELPKSAVGKTKDDKKLKLKPLEVLGAVDQLSKEEKKALKVILQKDEEEQAWATLRGDCPYVPESRGLAYEPPPRELPGAARASDDRRGSQGDVQLPHGPGHRGYLVAPSLKDHSGRDKAKAVRQRELEDFRKELYEHQVQGLRCTPSSAAPRPSESQARCHHRYNDLLWTANQHGHFARCSRCDLKHVIYYSVRHGVLMASHCMEARENTPTSSQVPWAPGLAVADTGCRTAVGGIRWHRALQEELQRRGIEWKTVPEQETFQFGSGDPVVSTTAVLYPVSLVPGMCDVLRMSVVEGPATLCPGLIGPSELSRWGVTFDFRTRQIVILDHPQEMRLTPTRHPALDLLGHLGAGDPWERPGMQERYDLLCRAPQSLAFVAGGLAIDEEPDDSTGSEEVMLSDHSGEDHRYVRKRAKVSRDEAEQHWLNFLKDDLGVKVIEDYRFVRDRQAEGDDDTHSEASTELRADADQASITSHEFGVQHLTSDGDTDEEEPDTAGEDVLENHPVHFLHKSQRKKLSQASRAICDYARDSLPGRSGPPRRQPEKARSGPPVRRPGPWRILEVFVGTMSLSLAAVALGWEAGQPISTPGFDTTTTRARAEARDYFRRLAPDLLVVSLPGPARACSVLGPGPPPAKQLQTWAAQHHSDGAQWRLAHDLLVMQRARAGAVLVYGAETHFLWTHPLWVAALEGLPKARTDLCAWEDHPAPLQQPTLLAANDLILRRTVHGCPGTAIHRHPFSSESRPRRHHNGRWMCSGSRILPSRWCQDAIRGAEEALQHRARAHGATSYFSRAPMLCEEAFVEDDVEMLAEAPIPDEPVSPAGSWEQELDDWATQVSRDQEAWDAARAAEAKTGNDNHNQVPNSNSKQEGGEAIGNDNHHLVPDSNSKQEGGEAIGDDNHHLVPDSNSKQEGGPDGLEDLRDLLARAPRGVPEQSSESWPGAAPQSGSKLERLHLVHRRLGHPANEVLVRMLQMGGADEELVKMARGLQCPTCQMRKQPTRPLPTRPGTRPIAFNFEVHLDLKYIKDAKDELYVALSMVDAATCFHAARLLRCREPAHVAGKFMSGWIALFGVPVAVVLDQGGEFETEFIALFEAHSVASKVTGSHAPWQNGFCERQGALLGVAWSAAVQAEKAEGRQAMKIALACALQAKNATVSRRGHSAHQLVFGRQAYLPELLDEEVWQAAGMGQALSLEGEVARQSEMRAAAKIALLHGEVHEKLKAALRRAPGGQNRAFSPGEMVFFWSPASDLKRRRYRRDAGAWRGPAVVLLPDGAQKYFISWRGRCLLVAAANMKLASLEAADDHDLRLREAEAHLEKGFVDLSQEPGPSEEEEAPHSVQGPGLVVRRRRNALGRKMSEARNMMSNLKSVKKMLKVPLRGRRRPRILRPVEAPPREQEEPVVSQGGPAAEEDDPNAAGPPPDYVSEGGDSLSSMGEAELDDLMYQPPPSPETLRRRRRDLLDDVPAPVREIAKRRRESDNNVNPEVEQEEPEAKRLKDRSFYNYILAAVSEGEVYQQPVLKNEWLSRAEVDYLGELLDIPLEAVRLHRAPRKRLQAPGGNVRCHRTTLMLKPEGHQVLVAKETPGEMKLRPRRRVPFLWRGLTLFSRPSRRVSEKTFVQGGQEQSEKVFVEKDGVPFQLPPVSERVFWAACRDLCQATRNSEAFLLKLKASGKELDPRFFDSKEAKAFEEADAAEWAAWTKNNVVRRLSREEAARVPRHRIFRVPARVVRTNKAAVGSQQLIPKSRIVLPGHLDPDVGEIRTDSPTTQATAVRMTMILCVSKRWVCLLFDVSTAFLSGKEVGRELYVRPPRDLKGAGAQELWLILRSAYGLAEAPRLWYERAKELLKDCGFEELSFALCTFVWKHPKTKHVMAVLCLHVDDGMLAGDPKVVENIKNKINERFQIKVWNLVGEQPLDYLGLKVFVKNGVFYNDMTAYVLAIQAPDLKGLKKGEFLTGPSLKAYRRLVAQLRWPAHHVLPELLFEVSSLAQRVSGAKTEDLKEGVALLDRFHEAARQGKASLAFYPVPGKPTLVTFFDASLGKTAGGAAAQRGEVHFLTGEQSLRGPCAASILEFHSNKISRVVRSSMAAECCSLAASADKLVYNQKLLDALWYGATLVEVDWRANLQTEGHLVTDAKSVYDHLHGTSMASERQTALDILAVRQHVQEGVFFLHWIPTWRQFADGLTKAMPDLLFDAFRKRGTISLAESPEDRAEEERRAGIRRGQRERRKARMRPT